MMVELTFLEKKIRIIYHSNIIFDRILTICIYQLNLSIYTFMIKITSLKMNKNKGKEEKDRSFFLFLILLY